MKRQYEKTLQRIAALMLGAFLFLSPLAQAATNTGIGDVAGVDADLVDSNTFTLLTSTPTLFKAAFLTSDNSALTSGSTLPAGTSVDFLIYLNNDADLAVLDVGIQDTLVGFTYVAGTIHVLNTTAECAVPLACTAGEELTIYTDANVPAALLTDGAGDDAASLNGTTVEVGNNGLDTTNTQQDAAANVVLALVFTATID